MDNNFYLVLSYHYLLSTEKQNLFPRIIGNTLDDFYAHLEMLEESYGFISLGEALDFSWSGKKPGMLLSFDDGLADHYLIAKILAERGIKAVFFIPTCILEDELPPNPMIIHYGMAIYGIKGFLEIYREGLKEFDLSFEEYDVKFQKGKDDLWEKRDMLKSKINYKMDYPLARSFLLYIYENLLLKNYSDILETIHLTKSQIHEIVEMGHSIGAHSHTHVSVASADLSDTDFKREIVDPKKYLEKIFGVAVEALSYPFGFSEDCLSSIELIKRTKQYKLAFSIEEKINTISTSPFELGRYLVRGWQNVESLKNALKQIIQKATAERGKGEKI